MRILIMGAAGKDFHTFNTVYRDRKDVEVVAFTATQIPDIAGRQYPPGLSGPLYPEGIPIFAETDLPDLIPKLAVDEVVFAYSDVSYQYLMERAAMVAAAGASFSLPSPEKTALAAAVPVISVCAVRTGCGKSQTTRKIGRILTERGKKVVVIRHPMPYGDLAKQAVQRFRTLDDLSVHKCTIEEREEYEPHLASGALVMAGVDYGAILKEAEKEADIILWDGGNNDTPFYRSNLEIVVVDPHRAGHERSYYPGAVNFLRARVIVINKMDTAPEDGVRLIERNLAECNPDAIVIKAASRVTVEREEQVRGKSVLVVEDGPTLTHGEMSFGAGVVAANNAGASQLVDPRPYLSGSLKETFARYPQIGSVLPAMGYGENQIGELERAINQCPCDAVLIATPIDLAKLITINKPSFRVTYSLEEIGSPDLEEVLSEFV